jgi:hypothetical protein
VETLEQKIERFVKHFARHIEVILESDTGHDGSLYARLLLTSLLDTLSAVAFPGEKVGKRFMRFVMEFSGWEDAKRVSLLHLHRLLRDEARVEFTPIKEWVDQRFTAIFPLNPKPTTAIRRLGDAEQSIVADPNMEDVLLLWPRSSDTLLKIGRTGVEDLQHGALLYQYRNFLVHEFRVPGRGWDVTKEGEPFYQKMIEVEHDLTPVRERWELVYPLAFLGTICRNALTALGGTLQLEKRNPFNAFAESSYWLRSLGGETA